jgi:hypothetical protein
MGVADEAIGVHSDDAGEFVVVTSGDETDTVESVLIEFDDPALSLGFA